MFYKNMYIYRYKEIYIHKVRYNRYMDSKREIV